MRVPARTICRAFVRLAVPTLVAAAAIVLQGAPASADVEVIMTADNAYSFGWGPESGIPGVQGSTAEYYGPVVNAGQASTFTGCPPAGTTKQNPGNPNGVERFVVPDASLGGQDYFYLAAWSDDTNWQGVLGSLEDLDTGSKVLTGDPRWEVCATGENFGANGSDNPSLAKVNEWIRRCNEADGDLGPATSGGWVTESKTFGQGNLHIDHAATNADPATAAGKGYGPITCIDGDARWMWFNADPNPSFNALRNPPSSPPGATHHKEFLIFRLVADAVVQEPPCMTLTPLRVTCQPGPLGPSGCYRVMFRVVNDTPMMAHFVTINALDGGLASPAVIELPNPIGAGQQANVVFDWCPPAGTSPTATSFSVTLLDELASGCCARRLTVELPECGPTSECAQVPTATAECVPGGPPGAVKVKLWVTKPYAEPRMLYLVASGATQIETQPKLLGGVSGTFGPIEYTITGASASSNPRRVCFRVNLQPLASEDEPFDLTGPCCSEHVCVQIPFCGLPTPTPDPNPLQGSGRPSAGSGGQG